MLVIGIGLSRDLEVAELKNWHWGLKGLLRNLHNLLKLPS